MSEADDALREMAANRGCKLVRSRRRKPGGDFGRYGLKDTQTGKEVLGFGSKGLTATAGEIKQFLRGGAAASWKSSLGAAPRAKPAATGRKPRQPGKAQEQSRSEPARAKRAKPERAEPPPAAAPAIREARPKDSAAIASLIVELGYEVTEADVRRRLGQLRKAGEPPLVAEQADVVGCLTWHVTPVLHRLRPVGRITMLTVAEAMRGNEIGTCLLEAAEARLRELGCGLIEVTSNMKRMRAHGFYERHGYQRTSYRFAKTLQE
ncbi:MAG: GNAT family N-acetyltransferase [Allosphingosinicella sp.]